MTAFRRKLIEELSRDEGRIPHAYQDSEGYWTIGVGHLIDRRRGGGLPDRIIDDLLLHDINRAIEDLDRVLPWWRNLHPVRQRALVNMCFNLGWTKLCGFRRMLAALRVDDYEQAATEALDSRWATQVGPRATRIAHMLRYGVAP